MKAKDVMAPLKVHPLPGDGFEEFASATREARAWEKTCGVRSLSVFAIADSLFGGK
ncbi:MAG TPA: hypothetical protein PLA18_11310 [Deltaproteobacteria bacterium]|jgi:hypothetical protein|nr:hypothetical protein [Deltaproteobacteria bacterium]